MPATAWAIHPSPVLPSGSKGKMRTPRLIVTDAAGERAVSMLGERFRIGRRNTNDLVVSGIDVSREHAEIRREGEDFFLKDLGSRFGTHLNGEQVEERRLSHRDRIRLGPSDHVQIVFLLDEMMSDTHATGTSSMTLAGTDFRAVAILLKGLRALGSGKVLDEVLRLVLESTLELTGAERAAILLAGGSSRLDFRLGIARNGSLLSGDEFRGSRKVPERAFAGGAVVDEPNLEEIPDGRHGETIQIGIRSAIAVPLRLVPLESLAEGTSEQARIIGVIYLDRRGRGALLTPSAREALEALAAEAGVAIENARLYREVIERQRTQQELEFARRVQEALMPERLSEYPFCETAGTNIPSRSIGGDFFDCFQLPDGSVGFVLGDVAGKGPAAALLAASAQGMLVVNATHTVSPAEAMTRLNRAFCRRVPVGRFVTLFYGVLHPDGRLVFCNAGHNFPYVQPVEGEALELQTGGLPIGIMEDGEYEEEVIRLEPGQKLIVFSDGITEAETKDGELYGEDRLKECLQSLGSASAEDSMERILEEVTDFVDGHEASDDITLFVLRYFGAKGNGPS